MIKMTICVLIDGLTCAPEPQGEMAIKQAQMQGNLPQQQQISPEVISPIAFYKKGG